MKLHLHPELQEKIGKLLKVEEGNSYSFLGYNLNLQTNEIHDFLSANGACPTHDAQLLNIILSHYASANPIPKTGNLVKFKDLPGGYAYEMAFIRRAIQPVARIFGDKPSDLIETAKLLGGVRLEHGDASVEISALEGIPISYIIWGAGEFSATATILFDASANRFLPTEDLAVLAEFTTSRLEKAYLFSKKHKPSTN